MAQAVHTTTEDVDEGPAASRTPGDPEALFGGLGNRATVAAGGVGLPRGAASMTQLQRSVGNAALTQMLTRTAPGERLQPWRQGVTPSEEAKQGTGPVMGKKNKPKKKGLLDFLKGLGPKKKKGKDEEKHGKHKKKDKQKDNKKHKKGRKGTKAKGGASSSTSSPVDVVDEVKKVSQDPETASPVAPPELGGQSGESPPDVDDEGMPTESGERSPDEEPQLDAQDEKVDLMAHYTTLLPLNPDGFASYQNEFGGALRQENPDRFAGYSAPDPDRFANYQNQGQEVEEEEKVDPMAHYATFLPLNPDGLANYQNQGGGPLREEVPDRFAGYGAPDRFANYQNQGQEVEEEEKGDPMGHYSNVLPTNPDRFANYQNQGGDGGGHFYRYVPQEEEGEEEHEGGNYLPRLMHEDEGGEEERDDDYDDDDQWDDLDSDSDDEDLDDDDDGTVYPVGYGQDLKGPVKYTKTKESLHKGEDTVDPGIIAAVLEGDYTKKKALAPDQPVVIRGVACNTPEEFLVAAFNWTAEEAKHYTATNKALVKYLSGAERVDYELHGGTSLIQGKQTKPFSTEAMYSKFGGLGWGIYVLSPDGTIYADQHKIGLFHHSSFLAGKETAAGGEIATNSSGKVIGISNKTGHYMSNEENLHQMLVELKGRGVPLDFKTNFVKANNTFWHVNTQEFYDNPAMSVAAAVKATATTISLSSPPLPPQLHNSESESESEGSG